MVSPTARKLRSRSPLKFQSPLPGLMEKRSRALDCSGVSAPPDQVAPVKDSATERVSLISRSSKPREPDWLTVVSPFPAASMTWKSGISAVMTGWSLVPVMVTVRGL